MVRKAMSSCIAQSRQGYALPLHSDDAIKERRYAGQFKEGSRLDCSFPTVKKDRVT